MKKAIGLLAAASLALVACGGTSGDPPGGLTEAVGVEGNWRIDVVNPDGSIDGSYTFQNAFFGAQALSRGLADPQRIVDLRLSVGALDGAVRTNLCPTISPGSVSCSLSRADGPPELELSADPATWELVFNGSFTAESSASIDNVGTRMEICDADPDPDCNSRTGLDITRHEFAPADEIPVSEGQMVQVEVRVAFS